ncbi:hypothetical protein B0T18DRAFT_169587 [Schizothecium vesticola]|uniref:Uncharacterized protein n=1 Tax=Schizothecium vesticola TaxID=314040 RepID=A0AA40ENV5_9PEZI|nr:hypothetical protein B0T18DRAFT_169587 [Schizothecium vesticola]
MRLICFHYPVTSHSGTDTQPLPLNKHPAPKQPLRTPFYLPAREMHLQKNPKNLSNSSKIRQTPSQSRPQSHLPSRHGLHTPHRPQQRYVSAPVVEAPRLCRGERRAEGD